MSLQVGILGGAFNPPHNAHLKLAEYAIKSFKLDKLIYIPSKNPPHKVINGMWNDFVRYLFILTASCSILPEDLKKSIEKEIKEPKKTLIEPFIEKYSEYYQKFHNEKISVSDMEIRQNSIAYTIDTIETLLKGNPEWSVKIIIGMDQAAIINSWKDWKKLIRIAEFCVAERNGIDEEKVKQKFPFLNLFYMPEIDISSTMIREKIRSNISIKGLVPEIIEEMIKLMEK